MNSIQDFSTYNFASDAPDTRDIQMGELFGSIPQVTLPSKVMLDQTPPLNQGQRGACTVFGSSGALFETVSQDLTKNALEYTQPYDPWTVWAEALKKGASDTNGWIIQSALQLIADMKLSNGYALIGGSKKADLYTLKYWIAQGRAITTGTQFGNWSEIVKTGIYSESSRNAGHCWQINGYDDSYQFPDGSKGGFHCPNSWGGLGEFWISYSMINSLFSQYTELGTEDIPALKILKDKNAQKYLELSKSKGIWNGDRPKDIATVEEIRVMINRGLSITGPSKTREFYATSFSDKILRGKVSVTIWNAKDGKKIATDIEIATMFTRASRRDPGASVGVMTREQVAIVIGRDFLYI